MLWFVFFFFFLEFNLSICSYVDVCCLGFELEINGIYLPSSRKTVWEKCINMEILDAIVSGGSMSARFRGYSIRPSP